jgi:O-antigen/teichoic acid export membrane protein
MGILISLFLGFASDTVCTTLFTSKYAFVAPVLTALAPAVLAVSVSQLLVWTLVASNQFRYALIGSSVQFLALVLGGWAVFTIKGNLLQNLALIHTVSATLGVVAFIIFLQKIPPYRLRRARLDAMIWRYRKSGS